MNDDSFTWEELAFAIRELKLARASAQSDFYSSRRKALDLAIEILQAQADKIIRFDD